MARQTGKEKQGEAFIATMTTESFEFYALGRTESEAKRAVAKKFHELALEHMTIAQLDDYYGIQVIRLGFGEAARF